MVVCQFFLKGNCKFGNNCRNEHASSNSGFSGRPTFGQNLNDRYHFTAAKGGNNNNNNNNLFGAQSSTNTSCQVDQNTLQTFRKDLQDWDVNKVWPLSCYAAQREHKCLPGLSDHSPEELRLEAYNYKETGNFDTYVNGLSSLSNQVMNRRNQLKTMSNEMVLKEINSCNAAAPPTTNLTSASPFSTPSSNLYSTGFGGTTSQPSTGLFGNSVQPTAAATSTTSSSIFGVSNQSQGLFSGNTAKSTLNNPFLASTSGGLFKPTEPAPSSLFGSSVGPFSSNTSAAASSGGLFSTSAPAAAPSGGLFSTSAPTASSGGLFGTSAPTASSGGLFGSNAPTSASSGGLFGSSAPTSASSGGLFGSSAPTSASSGGLFGSAPSCASILPTPFGSSTNPFGATTNTSTSGANTGLFGSNPTAQVILQDSKAPINPFLSASANSSQMPVGQPPPAINTPPVYSSKLRPITAADIEKFKAAKFVVGQIPTCPPPIELC